MSISSQQKKGCALYIFYSDNRQSMTVHTIDYRNIDPFFFLCGQMKKCKFHFVMFRLLKYNHST